KRRLGRLGEGRIFTGGHPLRGWEEPPGIPTRKGVVRNGRLPNQPAVLTRWETHCLSRSSSLAGRSRNRRGRGPCRQENDCESSVCQRRRFSLGGQRQRGVVYSVG